MSISLYLKFALYIHKCVYLYISIYMFAIRDIKLFRQNFLLCFRLHLKALKG